MIGFETKVLGRTTRNQSTIRPRNKKKTLIKKITCWIIMQNQKGLLLQSHLLRIMVVPFEYSWLYSTAILTKDKCVGSKFASISKRNHFRSCSVNCVLHYVLCVRKCFYICNKFYRLFMNRWWSEKVLLCLLAASYEMWRWQNDIDIWCVRQVWVKILKCVVCFHGCGRNKEFAVTTER